MDVSSLHERDDVQELSSAGGIAVVLDEVECGFKGGTYDFVRRCWNAIGRPVTKSYHFVPDV